MIKTYNLETLVSVKVKEKEFDDRAVFINRPKNFWHESYIGFISIKFNFPIIDLKEIEESTCFAISFDKKLYVKDKVILKFVNDETKIIYFDSFEEAKKYHDNIVEMTMKLKLTFND